MRNIQVLYLITGHVVLADVQDCVIKSSLIGGEATTDPDKVLLVRPVRVELVQHQGQVVPVPQPFAGLLGVSQGPDGEYPIRGDHIVCSVPASKELEDLHMEYTSVIKKA